MTINCPHFTLSNTNYFIMTRTLALGMLAQGNTGSEILQILDVIQADADNGVNIVENDTSITLEF